MKGIVFAFLAGAFITLQGVANARISDAIGTWQAATLTQLTGFVAAMLIFLFVRDGTAVQLKQVHPLYLMGGGLAAFVIDGMGWFGVKKQKIRLPQIIGILLMAAGVVILKM